LKVSEFSESSFVRELHDSGVWLRTGPFQTHLQTSIEFVARTVYLLYSDFLAFENAAFADFHVRIEPPSILRRWYRPQVRFYIDDVSPFQPLALDQAFALLEWSLNWCVSAHAYQYLVVHAAVIERNGHAAILAAPPGSGKSTLTAALTAREWRLLSDELALINPTDGVAIPIARPISLKNESIEVIREFLPGAVIGPEASDTAKGTVAHLKPPADSVNRANEPALPKWVIFPKFEAGVSTALTDYKKANSLLQLADSAFNYCEHGAGGFEVLSDLIERCECYRFIYSNLEEAIAVFDSLSS
jgi:HprK-related kinase A